MNKYQQKHVVALSSRQKKHLNDITRRGKHNARVICRAQILLRSSNGTKDATIASELRVSTRTVERIRLAWSDGGLDRALFDLPRPGQPRKLGDKAEQYLIAVACTDPPEGADHWTLELLRDRMIHDGKVKQVSTVTLWHRLNAHDLKPWREKNVVRPIAHAGVH